MNEAGDCHPRGDHLLQWSFTIPAENGVRGRMFFWETSLAAVRTLEKVKAVTSVML
jgi:hypothetical protein